jgi:hypothetical protein
MTDARLPERWLNDRRITRLSDPAFRAFGNVLMWSAGNLTDGVITARDLDDIPRVTIAVWAELVEAGLFGPLGDDGDRWLFVEHLTQPTRAEVEAAASARGKAREKKARQRAGKAGDKPADQTPVPGDVPGDITGQDRTGQARTGKEGDHRNETGPAHNGYDPNPEWCSKCGDKPTVVAAGAGARDWDDRTLCRGCNDASYAEAADWGDEESDR